MTDDIKAPDFHSKTDEAGDFNDGDDYNSVGSGDFNIYLLCWTLAAWWAASVKASS